jgi:uncharacterized membrane protein HdeD (DUF308 family)
VLVSGGVILLLGVLTWRQWPLCRPYAVGLFLGINLVVSGASHVVLGLSARKLPA